LCGKENYDEFPGLGDGERDEGDFRGLGIHVSLKKGIVGAAISGEKADDQRRSALFKGLDELKRSKKGRGKGWYLNLKGPRRVKFLGTRGMGGRQFSDQ